MTRVKTKVVSNVTLEQAQEASAQFANAATQLSTLEAKMNVEINKVKDKYQEKITDLQDSLKAPQEVLKVYANEQQESWGKKKSLELLHCVIGFRTGMPKVTKAKGFSWEAVTELAVKLFPHLVRTKSELDKEAVIMLSKEAGFREVKDKVFIDVVQEETFFVEAKKEEVPAN